MAGPGLDHVVVLHDDLAAAAAAARRLGFRPTPAGRHGQGLGTANVTVMMPDRVTYFEIMAIAEATARNEGKRAALAARGSHVHAVALSDDASASAARFAALGIGAGPAFDFARPVDLPGGRQEARFAIAEVADGTLPGLAAFVCQHFTRAAVWRPDRLDHPNGALAVTGLWGTAPEPRALARSFAGIFGAEAVAAGTELRIAAGPATLRYLSPAAWAERFGATPAGAVPVLRMIEIAVGARGPLDRALAAGGVAAREADGSLFVPDTIGFGAALLFTPAR
jgi:hypothetical protein